MSLPKIPDSSCLTRTAVINLILSSIAMEELGLAHILNAEGEKLQYFLGTLNCQHPDVSPEQVLQANESVQKLLETILNLEMILKGKMSEALNASVPQEPPCPVFPAEPACSTGPVCPTGPARPTGPACPTGPVCHKSPKP